jgi:peptide deformylase
LKWRIKMALRNIVKLGDPVLNKRSREVTKFDDKLSTLIDDMLETMYDANGVGLAAVQVGVLRRVVVIDIGEGPMELVNPEITLAEGEQREQEGCRSLPGRYEVTLRPMMVQVKEQDRNGKWQVFTGEDLKARAFCHELDHLDGVLFTSHIAPDEPQDNENKDTE